jgi:hypothetical protein
MLLGAIDGLQTDFMMANEQPRSSLARMHRGVQRFNMIFVTGPSRLAKSRTLIEVACLSASVNNVGWSGATPKTDDMDKD